MRATSLPPQEIGQRLTEARKSKGVSQEDAARAIGVSRPTYIALEKGARSAKPEEIVTLAALFGKAVHDILSPRPVLDTFEPQFRVSVGAKISDAVVREAIQEFRQVCEDYLMLEQLLDSPLPQFRYPDVYTFGRLPVVDAAEEIAQLERSRLNLGQSAISDLPELLEGEVGLRVFMLPLKEFKLAGMFYYTKQLGGCIMANGTHPGTRQRWTLAHEYGHFLVDRYRQEVTLLIDSERKPREEQFVDAFAAAFLMPASGVRQRFNHVLQSQNDFKVADMCVMADYFGVSVEAMTRRLESLRCVRRGMWDTLSRNLTPAQTRQHLGLEHRPGVRQHLPERYQRLAVQAWERELLTETKLARLLRCDRVEAREIVDRLTTTDEISAGGEPYQLNLDFNTVMPLVFEEGV